MANGGHLAILKSGPRAWNEWRLDNPTLCPDLREVNFTDFELESVNLYGVDAGWSDFSHMDLRGSDLANAVLRRSDLNGANLTGADIRGADLREADLSGTNLCGADLSGSDLKGAIVSETILADAKLAQTKNLNSCRHYGPSVLDFRTLLHSPNLPLAFLRGCGLPNNFIDYLPSLVSEPIRFYSCFISYSHSDRAFAKCLHDTLQAQGIRCWLDEKQILPGDDIYDAVDRGIRWAEKFLLCCSEASLTSWWVDNEIDKVFQMEQRLMKDHKRRRLILIPLDLDGHVFSRKWTSGKASQVLSRFTVDFNGWEKETAKFQAQIERIVLALRTDRDAGGSWTS